MLPAPRVVGVVACALEFGSEALDPVRAHVVADVPAPRVRDGFQRLIDRVVGRQFDRVDLYAKHHVLPDERSQVDGRCGLDRLDDDGSGVALAQAGDGELAHSAVELGVGVFVPLFAADVGLVNRNDAAHLVHVLGEPNRELVGRVPGGLLRDAEVPCGAD